MYPGMYPAMYQTRAKFAARYIGFCDKPSAVMYHFYDMLCLKTFGIVVDSVGAPECKARSHLFWI